MRKYRQYKGAPLKSKFVALAVMVAALFFILYFGRDLSDGIARWFSPSQPVADFEAMGGDTGVRAGAVEQAVNGQSSCAVISSSFKNAALKILPILSLPHAP